MVIKVFNIKLFKNVFVKAFLDFLKPLKLVIKVFFLVKISYGYLC